jgi:hypothetical protein
MTDKLTGDALAQALEERNLPNEGTADEKRAAVAAYDAEHGSAPAPEADSGASTGTPEVTRLDSDTTKPSTTAPGDGPADTSDPTETAHSVTPQPSAEALKVGTVNAVVPGEKVETPKVDASEHRIERYEAVKPDGTTVTVTHNIDTGETSVS